MEQIIDFFEHIPRTFRAGILIGGIVFFWIIEGIIPLFAFKYKKFRHAGINLILTSFTLIIGLFFAGILLWGSEYTSSNGIGLLHIVSLPLWGQAIVGVLLLDLVGAYFIHWLEHKVKWMWKFHLVHHSDTTVDVTTGLRHHPGEIVFRMTFTVMAVMFVGAPMWIVMMYQTLSALFAHLTHANIKMPEAFDKALSYIFVTPYMHKIHHHYQQPLTDTNYGNIFSIWDRIFGTYASVDKIETLVYGIDTHMDPKENDRLGNLFAIPFQKYRVPEDVKDAKFMDKEKEEELQES